MGWLDVEAVRLFCPGFADVLERGKPFECLEALAEVVDVEVGEVGAKLLVVFIVVAPDGGLLERAVHA